jgi:hypothetical protein
MGANSDSPSLFSFRYHLPPFITIRMTPTKHRAAPSVDQTNRCQGTATSDAGTRQGAKIASMKINKYFSKTASASNNS